MPDSLRVAVRRGKVQMKTYMVKQSEVDRKWYVVDLEGKVLGRAAVKIATVLMGKHRPQYTPHVDTGDFVIALNAAKVRVTGSKPSQRMYERYSGYPSGRKEIPLAEMLAKRPERVVREAVRRMLPKSRLGRAMFKKLKVYAGSEHSHQAQQPEVLEV